MSEMNPNYLIPRQVDMWPMFPPQEPTMLQREIMKRLDDLEKEVQDLRENPPVRRPL